MKKIINTSTIFLRIIIVILATIIVVFLAWFPQVEGRATDLDLISIYKDPFIIYIYFASIPFFFGLYQAYKLLDLIDKNQAFSAEAINSLRKMKFASASLVICIFAAVVYIRFFVNGDDPVGPIMLGTVLTIGCSVIATGLGIIQKLFQNAVDLKSENDLTI